MILCLLLGLFKLCVDLLPVTRTKHSEHKGKTPGKERVYFSLYFQLATESGQDLKGRNLEAGMESR